MPTSDNRTVTAANLIARYKAGERDFSDADLSDATLINASLRVAVIAAQPECR